MDFRRITDDVQFAQTAPSTDFWILQFTEHLQMIRDVLGAITFQDHQENIHTLQSEADVLYARWSRMQTPAQKDLEVLLAFKKRVLTALSKAQWIGFLPLSAYEDMIKEVEYYAQPTTGEKTLKMWLTDLSQHVALDVVQVDPVHGDIIRKSLDFQHQLKSLARELGESPNADLVKLEARISTGQIVDYPAKNMLIVLGQLKSIAVNIAQFHLELVEAIEEGRVLSTMSQIYSRHMLRESYRAVKELSEIAIS